MTAPRIRTAWLPAKRAARQAGGADQIVYFLSAPERTVPGRREALAFLRADGQEQHSLVKGSEIRARRADRTLTLIRSRERDFFGVVRAKLHLGDLPRS